jgi:DNA modification methylase
MKKHKFNLYPELAGEAFDRLKESINAGFDKTFPIIFYEGAILDGWNRYRACKELRVEYTEKEFRGNDQEALDFVFRSNARRDLNASQRSALAAEYEPIIAEQAEIVRRAKISSSRKGIETVENFPPSQKSREIAGEMFGVNDRYVSDAKRIKEDEPEIFAKLKSGEITLQEVKEEMKAKVKAERIKQENIDRKKIIAEYDIRHGDFVKVIDDVKNIDAIITDPPYPLEFINVFSDLSKYASTHLKDGGFCVVYSGQYNLPEVIKRLSEHLTYVWTFCLYHVGKKQLVNGVNIMCGWKPVLVFSKGNKKMRFSAYDVVVSEQMEKHSHEWQQSESGVEKLIEIFTKPGELVVDPFSGGGTFVKAAIHTGRRGIGAEIK